MWALGGCCQLMVSRSRRSHASWLLDDCNVEIEPGVREQQATYVQEQASVQVGSDIEEEVPSGPTA